MPKKAFFLFVAICCFIGQNQAQGLQKLSVSANQRYLQTADGKPFFWLGETGWLMLSKLSREEVETYLETRRKQGFNVVQIMVLHTLEAESFYKVKALNNKDISKPLVTPGNSPDAEGEYDYWDHLDYAFKVAEQKGIYLAIVPVWGTAAKTGPITKKKGLRYAKFLTKRYKNQSNVIWLNGGDINGGELQDVWNKMGDQYRKGAPNHLITFHPRGRTTSSYWFHTKKWLDFNMFQSGHRNYSQDTSANETLHYGEDNWKHVVNDLALLPAKPTIDGEPSYEEIPHGLHKGDEPYWEDKDVRRYGYWSVFAGAFGYTYGHNAVMQMNKPTDKGVAFFAKSYWYDAVNSPGANQMQYLKELMLSRPFFERIPDQSMIANQGQRYQYLLATRGARYAMVYTYTGKVINLNMGKIEGNAVMATWFNPRNGMKTVIGPVSNTGVQSFDPPGNEENGNDWVLIIDSI